VQHPGVPAAGVYVSGAPIVFSGSTARFDMPPTGVDEHNEEVYGGLWGYAQAELRSLKYAGMI
jgi:hypothetical protein